MDNISVYGYIESEKNSYERGKVSITNEWSWGMFDHITEAITYKFGQLLNGKDENKPVKNIVLPILRLRYRTEGFDVKDINIFINSPKDYWKSFFIRKFHEKWARDTQMDTFIDEASETDIDFGGVLVKDTGKIRPEVVPWQRVAFCDQTNVLSGPICEKHSYTPAELRKMKSKGWNADEIEMLIRKNSEQGKEESQAEGQESKTPGVYIEVYELHGELPENWLKDNEEIEGEVNYINQVQIISYYQDESKRKQGTTLYRGKENFPYKFRADAIYGRALGYGGVEELVEPQVWTNYSEIRKKEMMDAASKIVLQTTDKAIARRNNLNDVDNLEILGLEEGKRLEPVNLNAGNAVLFDNAVKEWWDCAQQVGSAFGPIMGEEPSSGTPFRSLQTQVIQGLGLHEHRMGKFAVFVEEIYRDWIFPKMIKDINKGQEFLSELSLEELEEVSDMIATNEANKLIKQRILAGQTILPGEKQIYIDKIKEGFRKGGNKRFIKTLQDEFKKASVEIQINIKGKQKDLVGRTDKLVNVVKFMLSTYDPNTKEFLVFKDPRMMKVFNTIIESSGLEPIDFYSPKDNQPIQAQPIKAEAISPLGQTNNQPVPLTAQ